MKKIISLILIAVLLFTICSCGKEKNREYDEEEVKAAAQDLIQKSKKLNEIFWGKGIPYVEDDSYKKGQYYPADPEYLSKIGMESVIEILSETEKVFSKSYTDSISRSVFSAKTGDYGMSGYTRYYQGIEVIMVYTRYSPLLTDEVTYLVDQITVIGSKGEKVIVKVPVKVTRGDVSQTREIEVDLIEEENGWRIDSPTYTVYRSDETSK